MRKGIYILPNTLTLCGMLFGFFSILASVKGNYLHAAWGILFAMVFDGLDGWVARLTHSTTRFGIELDSLSDLVALGVAPSVLLYKWALLPFGRIGWVAAFWLIAIGYGHARAAPVLLWDPPLWTRHLSALLMLFAFVLVAAAYVPRNRIRHAVGHPMVLGVKIWAAGHLLANGDLRDLLLFGAFLAWAVFDYRAARQRDRIHGRVGRRGTLMGDAATLVIGAAAWAVFTVYLHGWLIGVRPFVS